ncbi:microtubule associated-domain-containing protein, partial [Circinella umbellata]
MADANIHSSSDNNTSATQHTKHSLHNDNNDINKSDVYHDETSTNGNNNSKAEAQKERSATLTLKEQEKTIDILNKENFGLKLKCYFLEKRLDDISPDQVDNALKENVDLKVTIQTLTQELKRYKKMILDLQ